jgi:hypothetical protein
MKPIPRPRLWVRLASVVALGFALWLLLVPRIALYYLDNDNGHVDDDQPYGVDVKYAWGRGTSDQMLIVPAHGWGDEDPIAWHGGVDGMVSHVRLNCGLVFTSGDNEAKAPGGAAACAEIETPRLIGGIMLALLGITGLGLAGRIRSSRGGEHIRGTDDLFRVDDISTRCSARTRRTSREHRADVAEARSAACPDVRDRGVGWLALEVATEGHFSTGTAAGDPRPPAAHSVTGLREYRG